MIEIAVLPILVTVLFIFSAIFALLFSLQLFGNFLEKELRMWPKTIIYVVICYVLAYWSSSLVFANVTWVWM